MSEDLVQRWCCVCAYDGGPFSGWQSQPGGNAIQDVIERRLKDVVKQSLRIHGSGRTDSGVHARGQVFHFDAAWPHGAEKFRLALRTRLHPAIQLRSLEPVGPGFHARFDVCAKRYRYHLHLGEADPFTRPFVWSYERILNLDLMAEAVELLRGRHDFASLSALNGTVNEVTVRDLRVLRWVRRGPLLILEAEAEGFLYKMMRSLVGALVAVGEGKLSLEELRQLLEPGSVRPPSVVTAPPQGLFLERVFYPVGAKKKRTRRGALEKDDDQLSD